MLVRIVFVGLAASLMVPTATASNGLRTVALSGQSIPGAASDAAFFSFASSLPPSLNNRGETVFIGRIAGNEVTASNDSGIWSEVSGRLDTVALEGDVAAGTPTGVVFGDFRSSAGVRINDAGQTSFITRLTGPGISLDNAMGIWRQTANTISLVAQSGDAAPGFAPDTKFGTFFTSVNPPPVGLVMNNDGTIAFQARTTAFSTGIWRFSESGLELFAGGGNPTPEPGLNFEALSGENGPVLNDRGQIAFNDLFGALTDQFQYGVWSDRGGNGIERVARTAMQAPGVEAGVTYSLFQFHPGINSSGQLAFTAEIRGPGFTGARTGLWSEGRGNGLELIALTGDQAPGTDLGVSFSVRFSERVLNHRGEVAFLSNLEGPGVDSTNDTGLWTEGGGIGLRLLARAGDQAPDIGVGIDFGTFSAADAPILNARGQAAFTNSLVGATIDSTNDRGIWAEDISGNLHLIARTGDLLDVSDDPMNPDMRTIAALSFQTRSGNDDGKASGFNDRGQLAFWARFTDSSQGIFVSNLVAVPEPACLNAAFLCIYLACLSRMDIRKPAQVSARPR